MKRDTWVTYLPRLETLSIFWHHLRLLMDVYSHHPLYDNSNLRQLKTNSLVLPSTSQVKHFCYFLYLNDIDTINTNIIHCYCVLKPFLYMLCRKWVLKQGSVEKVFGIRQNQNHVFYSLTLHSCRFQGLIGIHG